MGATIAKSRTYRGIVFAYIMLTVGYVLGTILLFNLVRPLVDWLHINSFSQVHQNIAVIAIIIFLVIISLLISIGWYKWFINSRVMPLKIIFILFITILFAGAVKHFIYPTGALTFHGFSQNGRVYYGSYPDKANMLKLKRKGFTTIISLLNPAILPAEPILLRRERDNAKAVGMKLIVIPLMPWIAGNREGFAKLREIASRKDNETYYVHCFIGKDRVAMAKVIFDEYSGVTK